MTWLPVVTPLRPLVRIGFFGGTFDPPHRGHVDLVRDALEELRLDWVFVCPNGYPHDKNALIAPEHRLQLTTKAMSEFGEQAFVIEDEMPWMQASMAPVRTYDTLKRRIDSTTALSPAARYEWYLLMGQDQAASFTSWHRYRELSDIATPVYMPRDETGHSSTAVRSAIESGDWGLVEQLVPSSVFPALRDLT